MWEVRVDSGLGLPGCGPWGMPGAGKALPFFGALILWFLDI